MAVRILDRYAWDGSDLPRDVSDETDLPAKEA
jgi:hypothetical protein